MNILNRKNYIFDYNKISNEHTMKHNIAFIENVNKVQNYTIDFVLINDKYKFTTCGDELYTLLKPRYINIKTKEKLTFDSDKMYLEIQFTVCSSKIFIPLNMCDRYQISDNEYIFIIPENIFFDKSIHLYIFYMTDFCISFDKKDLSNIKSVSMNYDISQYKYENKNRARFKFLHDTITKNIDIINIYNALGLCRFHKIDNNKIIYIYDLIFNAVLSTHLYIKMNKTDYENNLLSIKLILNGKEFFNLSIDKLNTFKKKINSQSGTLYFFIPIINYSTDNIDNANVDNANFSIQNYNKYKINADRIDMVKIELNYNNVDTINEKNIDTGVLNVCLLEKDFIWE